MSALADFTNKLDFLIGTSPADATADRELSLLKDGTYDLTYGNDTYSNPIGEIYINLETLNVPAPPSRPI